MQFFKQIFLLSLYKNISLMIFFTTMVSLSFGQKAKSYLALGDSYTIGESVPIYESFPYQTVKQLRLKGLYYHAPEIVAKTGWTTDELTAGINNSKLLKKYDFVTLLIGVNNQYRGRTAKEFATQFREILKTAITFANGKKENVVVLSIPDWAYTPFASSRDTAKISKEIDEFNALKKEITNNAGVTFIDITAGTREGLEKPTLVAKDKLHPSGDEYARWAEKIVQVINKK